MSASKSNSQSTSSSSSPPCPAWYKTSASTTVFVWVPLILGYILAAITAYFVTEFHRKYGGEEPYALYIWNHSVINMLSGLCLLPWVNMIAAPVLLTLVLRLTYVQDQLDDYNHDDAIPTLVVFDSTQQQTQTQNPEQGPALDQNDPNQCDLDEQIKYP